MTPTQDRIIVKKKDRIEKTEGGIYLPVNEKGKEIVSEGTVVKAGPGRMTEHGKLIPMRITEGQRVLFSSFAGVDIAINDVNYTVLRDEDVLVIMD